MKQENDKKPRTVKHTRKNVPIDVQRFNDYLLERLVNSEIKEFKLVRTQKGVLFLTSEGQHFEL